jgi:hypothetical protein
MKQVLMNLIEVSARAVSPRVVNLVAGKNDAFSIPHFSVPPRLCG